MLHHALESIQATTADDAAGRKRAMIVSTKASEQNGRGDADFVPPVSIRSAGVLRRLAPGARHLFGEAEVQRGRAKRFPDLTVEEGVVVFRKQEFQVRGMDRREVRFVDVLRLAQHNIMNVPRASSYLVSSKRRPLDELN